MKLLDATAQSTLEYKRDVCPRRGSATAAITYCIKKRERGKLSTVIPQKCCDDTQVVMFW